MYTAATLDWTTLLSGAAIKAFLQYSLSLAGFLYLWYRSHRLSKALALFGLSNNTSNKLEKIHIAKTGGNVQFTVLVLLNVLIYPFMLNSPPFSISEAARVIHNHCNGITQCNSGLSIRTFHIHSFGVELFSLCPFL